MAKRYSRTTGWLAGVFILMTLLLLAGVLFSPYGQQPGYSYKLVGHTVVIDAPLEVVFNYLGNSSHASDWSVYVHHITPLNADRLPDGSIGSRRRCFRQADETGIRWDELITEVLPNQKRQLTLNHLVGFPMSAKNLATEQIYRPLPNGKCQLTFTVFFTREPSWFDAFKMYLAAYVIKDLFKKNMVNIRHKVEVK